MLTYNISAFYVGPNGEHASNILTVVGTDRRAVFKDFRDAMKVSNGEAEGGTWFISFVLHKLNENKVICIQAKEKAHNVKSVWRVG